MTATYFDGWRNSAFLVIGGDEAELKAQRTGEAIFARTSAMLAAANLANYSETVATLSY